MSPDNNDERHHRIKVRLLYGLFEADATGTVAIGAALAFFALLSAGRWYGIW